MIFGDDTLMLVAHETEDERILGTASVVLDIGAYTDLLGEFGRLAVHPDARGRRIGTLLMEGRLERVRDRLHVGVTEARVEHSYSQRIAAKNGFASVGFLPMKVKMATRREHVALMIHYFGHALDLRRNNPRIIPEVYRLAGAAMEHVGIVNDLIVDERSAPYPYGGGYEVRELTTDGYSDLLRIERGRVRRREVFGPLRLHYGVFKLRAADSSYLIAGENGQIAGAVGFTHDPFENNVRVFELIALEDDSIRFLLGELVARSRGELGAAMIEIDVGADAPRMQRTLLELGFVPGAYVPAMAFHHVERRDVVKFVLLLEPLDLGTIALIPEAQAIADVVLATFTQRHIVPRIRELADRVALFKGLNEEQVQRLAGIAEHDRFEAGSRIFDHGEPSGEMYLILKGAVDIRMPGQAEPVGTVEGGECLGEVGLLTGLDHTAAADVRSQVEAGIVTRERLNELVRQRPDIGVVLYRNLALGLGDKLHRTDLGQVEED